MPNAGVIYENVSISRCGCCQFKMDSFTIIALKLEIDLSAHGYWSLNK